MKNLEDYRSIYKDKETKEEVRVRNTYPGQYVVLTNAGEKIRMATSELRKKYKYVRHIRCKAQLTSGLYMATLV